MTGTAKRLAIALACSLAVNLFLAGFFATRAMHGGRHHGRGHHGHFMGPHGLAGGDPAVRQAVRGAMQRRDGELRAHGEQLHRARAAVGAAFRAEPFDAQALQRALSDLRVQSSRSQELMHESLIEIAPRLTSEQRARLAERALEREGPR